MGQGGAPGQQTAPGQPTQPGQPPQGEQPQVPPAQMIVQALSSLPPQVLKAIGNALAQGASPQQVFEQLTQQSNQGAA
jgi:hypothetical protein